MKFQLHLAKTNPLSLVLNFRLSIHVRTASSRTHGQTDGQTDSYVFSINDLFTYKMIEMLKRLRFTSQDLLRHLRFTKKMRYTHYSFIIYYKKITYSWNKTIRSCKCTKVTELYFNPHTKVILICTWHEMNFVYTTELFILLLLKLIPLRAFKNWKHVGNNSAHGNLSVKIKTSCRSSTQYITLYVQTLFCKFIYRTSEHWLGVPTWM